MNEKSKAGMPEKGSFSRYKASNDLLMK